MTFEKSMMFPDDNDPFVTLYFKQLKPFYYNAFGTDESLYSDANPFENMQTGKGIPQFLCISAPEDFRSKPNRDLVNKLNSNDVKSTPLVVSGYDHGAIIDFLGSPLETLGITSAVIKFITKQD